MLPRVILFLFIVCALVGSLIETPATLAIAP